MVHCTAEYCAPVWCLNSHIRLIDKPINDGLRIVTECLCPTPTDSLHVLVGIQPSKLRHEKNAFSLACRAQEPEHLLDDSLLSQAYRGQWQLKSRHPFMLATLDLLDHLNKTNTSAAHGADYRWNMGGKKDFPTSSVRH